MESILNESQVVSSDFQNDISENITFTFKFGITKRQIFRKIIILRTRIQKFIMPIDLWFDIHVSYYLFNGNKRNDFHQYIENKWMNR